MPEKREREEVTTETEKLLDREDGDAVMTAAERNSTNRSSSTAVTPPPKATVSSSASGPKHVFSPELLSQYYKRLFPFDLLHSWLSYDPSSSLTSSSSSSTPQHTFTHREFSFTIEPVPGEEIYIRYQSFLNQAELTQAVHKRNPHKIDIGAVFSHPPKDHLTIQGSSQRSFHPVQRELVFDVDLTDYDCVRRCGCGGADICSRCWKMMTMAVKVMDSGLKEDFGFQNVAWFYSGRRGIHAWICDESARTLSDAGRSAVASYFEVNLGTEKNQNVDLTSPLHPTLERSVQILEPMFVQDILPASGHGLLATQESWTELLSTLPPSASSVSDSLLRKWNKDGSKTSPEEKWTELRRFLNVFTGKTKGTTKQPKQLDYKEKSKIELWPVATIFKYTYPRLDINVSKMQNHLLKSPFCVHPKTGRVCIPIDAKKVDSFDPFAVPTLPQLMQELDEYDTHHTDGNQKVRYEWEKTSLKESFGHFEKFLNQMWKDQKRMEKDKMEQRAALTGDF